MVQTQLFVAALVMRDAEVLLVRQAKGHSLAGQWTVPWGKVEPGESPMAAAIREVQEEAGVEAAVEGLLGVQELPEPQDGGVALVYLCKHLDGDLVPQDRETDAACYYTLSALDTLMETVEPWSHWLVRRVFADELTVTRADQSNPLQAHGAFL